MTSTLPPLTQAVTGALGSASANALAYPLDLVTTRLQTTRSRKLQGFRGAIAIIRNNVKTHGIGSLYDGLASDTASTILSNFLYFYTYTLLRTRFLLRLAKRQSTQAKPKLPVLAVEQELLLGFIAGVCSRLVTTPLSVITVRLQTQREEDLEDPSDERESGIMSAAKSIYNQDGILGLWRGFESTILLSFNPALTFAFLHFIRRILHFRSPQRLSGKTVLPPAPLESFVTAALANAAAVSILYPLILAKTRMQVAKKTSLPVQATFDKPDLHITTEDLTPMTQSKMNTLSKPNLASTLSDAYNGRDGYSGGLYQGISAQVLKGIISMGVTIMVKERIENVLVRALRRWRG